jgi:hypothetical protein
MYGAYSLIYLGNNQLVGGTEGKVIIWDISKLEIVSICNTQGSVLTMTKMNENTILHGAGSSIFILNIRIGTTKRLVSEQLSIRYLKKLEKERFCYLCLYTCYGHYDMTTRINYRNTRIKGMAMIKY